MSVAGGPNKVVDNLSVYVDFANPKSNTMVDNNILGAWVSAWASGSGSTTGFGVNGSVTENHRIYGEGPFGNTILLWEARPDAVSGPDGGWDSSTFSIDKTSMYRFSTWVKRSTNTDGRFYLGLRGFGSVDGVFRRNSSTTNDTNPYFMNSITFSTPGVWYLIVAHVWPAGTGTGASYADTGIYTVSDGKITNINDFIWRSETTSARHRSYLFYGTNVNQRQYWAYPRVDKLDGTEPTIQQLLTNDVNTTTGLITSNNYSFINNPTFTKNRGGRLELDGTNDSLEVDNSLIHTSLERTVEIVFEMSSIPALRAPIAVYTNTSSTNTGKRYWLGIQSGKFQMHGWGTSDPNSTTTISANTIYHVTFAYSQNSKQMYIWVNGILEKQITNSEAGMTGWSDSSTEKWFLGRDPRASSWTAEAAEYSPCRIYLFKQYNRVLTTDEVRRNYRAVKGRFGL